MIQNPDSIQAKASTIIPQPSPADAVSEQSVAVGMVTSGDSVVTPQEQQSFIPRHHVPDSLMWHDPVMPLTEFAATDTVAADAEGIHFDKDSLFHTELNGGRYGFAGDPVPYNLRSDNVLTSVIIVSILLVLYSVKRAAKFFSFQLRNFFRVVRNDSSLMKEAASDTRHLVFISVHAAMVLALVFFFYSKENIGETYITYSEYSLMAIYFAEIVGYFLSLLLLQHSVNSVFFSKQQCDMWVTSKLLLSAIMGLLLTPLLLLVAYFGLQTENAIFYTLIVIVLIKLSAFCKVFLIFFRKINLGLQFFLYLCTLEVIPIVILWAILLLTANYLKVNY